MSEITRTKISVTSRASVKIGDSYFTFEETLEDTIKGDDYDCVAHKQSLWDEANADIDAQILDVKNLLKK